MGGEEEGSVGYCKIGIQLTLCNGVFPYIIFFGNLNFASLCFNTIRVFPLLAKLTSKYEYQNPSSLRDMTIFVIFQKVSKSMDFNYFT